MDRETIKQIIRELLAEREQQITYPIDDTSKSIVDKDNLLFSSFETGATVENGHLIIKINNQTYEINVKQI